MLPGQGWYGSTKGAIAMKSFCYDGWRQIKGTVQTYKNTKRYKTNKQQIKRNNQTNKQTN